MQWINWARIDLINGSLCILPADDCQIRPRKPGAVSRTLAGLLGSKPDTRQYFKVTYSVSECKPDPRRPFSILTGRSSGHRDYFEESRFTTNGAYVEPETGLLRVSSTTHTNITFTPHIIIDPPQSDKAPSLQVIWRKRALKKAAPTTEYITKGYL